MATVKTAISVRKSLFEDADKLARKMQISRSRLFSLALEEFIQRWENRELSEAINKAYGDEPSDPEEEEYQKKLRRHHMRMMLQDEW